ncbi:MAG: hypothetical protein F6J97_05870 [Leptolyngbya sp. SIO4C1]|nr:hypothetical protein [Leptolyngbya sp. SIO4C1]
MERGLLWLPLLTLFIWLAWAGWNEYQKLESYKIWAQQFERAKYDIYAALGQTDNTLTWGTPTRQGPTDLKTLSLNEVGQLALTVNEQPTSAALSAPPKGRICLHFDLGADRTATIPFTDWAIAKSWYAFLAARLGIEPLI